MKYNILVISFLVLIISSNLAISDNNYIINEDTVYIDDSKVYLSATPHTLSSSEWVYFNLTSKVYMGNIDACWGFNTSVSKPTKAELYKPHWINTTTNHEKTFYNLTFYVYTGNNLDYGNSYNTNYKYTITEPVINDNGTTYITSNVTFDSFDTEGVNYTIYWHNRHDNYYLWEDFSSSFISVIHDYKGYNKWYYIKNVPITSNKEYTVRAWIDVPVSIEKQSGKYYFAIKPSGETISQAVANGRFYNLDPWWNATWLYRKEIILTGNTSGAQTDYQLLLNVSYETGMQIDFDDLRFTNETHELNSWVEYMYTPPEPPISDYYALVWVEFPTTPANGVNQTYYMYYGNAGAASAWDGVATFIVFDDFEDALQEGWINITGTIDYANTDHAYGGSQCMKVSASSRTEIPVTHSDDITTRYRIWKKDAAKICYWHSDTNWVANIRYDTDETIDYYTSAYQSTGSSIVADQWELMESRGFVWASHTHDIIKNDVSIQNNAEMWNYGVRAQNAVEFENSAGDTIYIDDFIVRKYAANPPTYAFGSEEEYYIPPIPTAVVNETKLIMSEITSGLKGINVGNYLVYAFILIGILLIILLIQILNNCVYRE